MDWSAASAGLSKRPAIALVFGRKVRTRSMPALIEIGRQQRSEHSSPFVVVVVVVFFCVLLRTFFSAEAR